MMSPVHGGLHISLGFVVCYVELHTNSACNGCRGYKGAATDATTRLELTKGCLASSSRQSNQKPCRPGQVAKLALLAGDWLVLGVRAWKHASTSMQAEWARV